MAENPYWALRTQSASWGDELENITYQFAMVLLWYFLHFSYRTIKFVVSIPHSAAVKIFFDYNLNTPFPARSLARRWVKLYLRDFPFLNVSKTFNIYLALLLIESRDWITLGYISEDWDIVSEREYFGAEMSNWRRIIHRTSQLKKNESLFYIAIDISKHSYGNNSFL